MKNSKRTPTLRILSLLLVTLMIATLAACGDKPTSKPSSDSIIENSSTMPSTSSDTTSSEAASTSNSGSSSSSSGAAPIPKDTRAPADIQKDILTKMVAAHQQNEDIVGYLYVPGTTVNEPVVQTVDNDYYLRRTYQNKNNFDGCYFVDFRAAMGNRSQLSKNIVIYGHSMDDNPDGTRFSQMKKFKDKNFASENQFVYFSTPESDMVWQIFAVFPTQVTFNYNNPNPSSADFLNLINDARKRSLLNFDLNVSSSDNIMTFSTCTYLYDPNLVNNYRYVVMAKLLPKGTTPTLVKVETNPSPKAP